VLYFSIVAAVTAQLESYSYARDSSPITPDSDSLGPFTASSLTQPLASTMFQEMKDCNVCRASLQKVCAAEGNYPSCQRSATVQRQLLQCNQVGMRILEGVLACPGDEDALPVEVECNACRSRLQDSCLQHGSYPECRKSLTAALRKCQSSTMMSEKEGVISCAGDAEPSMLEMCRACRHAVVSTCSKHGSFPGCLTHPQVKQQYSTCEARGLRHRSDTKALVCPGESEALISEATGGAVCDTCRRQMQSKCVRFGGYPSCLQKGIVKASLRFCVKRRGLKLVEGRLHCRGDTILKAPEMVESKGPSKHKPSVSARTAILQTATASKALGAAPAKKVMMKPPPNFLCAACRDRLAKTCNKLGGISQCQQIQEFRQIFESCQKFLQLSLRDGTFHCDVEEKHIAAMQTNIKQQPAKPESTYTELMPPAQPQPRSAPVPVLPAIPAKAESVHTETAAMPTISVNAESTQTQTVFPAQPPVMSTSAPVVSELQMPPIRPKKMPMPPIASNKLPKRTLPHKKGFRMPPLPHPDGQNSTNSDIEQARLLDLQVKLAEQRARKAKAKAEKAAAKAKAASLALEAAWKENNSTSATLEIS